MKINFFVDGIPKSQARPRFFRKGNFVGTYSPKTDFWKVCYYKALENRPKVTLDTSISVELTFYLPKPKSCPKSRIYPIVKPDLDNLAKGVMDALTQAGFWKDDALICYLSVWKLYAKEKSGVEIVIETLPIA